MKKKILIFLITIFFIVSSIGKAQAAMPTFDAVNAALNQLRNALMQSQFVEEMRIALEHLDELKAAYAEMMRFNSGWDELVSDFIGDPAGELKLKGENWANNLFGNDATPQIQFFSEAKTPVDIKESLQEITGKIPDGNLRPYIPFEEFEAVQGFSLAKEIRDAGERTRVAARTIAEESLTASPKGAARLAVQTQAHLMELAQQNQEAIGKLIELESTQIEQVTREEKMLESQRLKFMEDAGIFIDSIKKG